MKLKELSQDPQQRELCFPTNTQSSTMKQPVCYPDKNLRSLDVFSFDKQAFEAQFL